MNLSSYLQKSTPLSLNESESTNFNEQITNWSDSYSELNQIIKMPLNANERFDLINQFNEKINEKLINNDTNQTNKFYAINNLNSVENSAGHSNSNAVNVYESQICTRSNSDIKIYKSKLENQTNETNNNLFTVNIRNQPLVCLNMDGIKRLCLAQISSTLLSQYTYNEIHNRRVALGITCVQCSPNELELLREAGAMPASSRRCGTITYREAERLIKSFLDEPDHPKLPDNFSFNVIHHCGWGCRGTFSPTRYNSSRAKCIKCFLCQNYFSPNKFIFHCHSPNPNETSSQINTYRHPDAANFNAWRRHLFLADPNPSIALVYAWEDVKAMFNGGNRKRNLINNSNHSYSSSDEVSYDFLSNSLENPTKLNKHNLDSKIHSPIPKSFDSDNENNIVNCNENSYKICKSENYDSKQKNFLNINKLCEKKNIPENFLVHNMIESHSATANTNIATKIKYRELNNNSNKTINDYVLQTDKPNSDFVSHLNSFNLIQSNLINCNFSNLTKHCSNLINNCTTNSDINSDESFDCLKWQSNSNSKGIYTRTHNLENNSPSLTISSSPTPSHTSSLLTPSIITSLSLPTTISSLINQSIVNPNLIDENLILNYKTFKSNEDDCANIFNSWNSLLIFNQLLNRHDEKLIEQQQYLNYNLFEQPKISPSLHINTKGLNSDSDSFILNLKIQK